jgi:hypothetical protein
MHEHKAARTAQEQQSSASIWKIVDASQFVGAGFDLLGLDHCRRDPPAQLLRYGTKIANGKKRILHPV